MNILKTSLFALPGVFLFLVLPLEPAKSQSPRTTGFAFGSAATINDTRFIGDCPGIRTGDIRTNFLSITTPPSPGLRVMIENIGIPLNRNDHPYTDREYEQPQGSEDFIVKIGNSHNDQYLAVTDNSLPMFNRSNSFRYRIQRGEQVIETGAFAARFRVEVTQENRRAIVEQERYCLSGGTLANCHRNFIRTRLVRRCPNE